MVETWQNHAAATLKRKKKKHFFPPSVKKNKKKTGQKSGIPFCVKQKIMHSRTQTHTFLQCNQSWIVSIECTNFTLMGWNMMAAWGWCAVMETMSGAGAEGGGGLSLQKENLQSEGDMTSL